jgi:hypothetical protein
VSATTEGAAGRYVIILATIADVLGILGFVGVRAGQKVSLALVASLALLGTLAAGMTLITALRLLFSPRGSFYPMSHHISRIGAGVVALLIAVVLGGVTFSMTRQGSDVPRGTQTSPSPSPL